jgi:hypothetical protein
MVPHRSPDMNGLAKRNRKAQAAGNATIGPAEAGATISRNSHLDHRHTVELGLASTWGGAIYD